LEIQALSNLSRFRDIVSVLIRYGFEDLVGRIDLPMQGVWRSFAPDGADRPFPVRIRKALEELGPTFVKFGQILSLRVDLLPRPLIDELQKLQDEVAAVDFPEIRRVVEDNLGRPLPDVFSVFEPTPLAAASLSQVHRAVHVDGGPALAVKVQRPGIRSVMRTDLRIMQAIADRLHERIAELQLYDLPGLVRVNGQILMRELDFAREARHMRIARNKLAEVRGVCVPDVFEGLSTEEMLVMAYVRGRRITQEVVDGLADSKQTARNGLNASIQQIFQDGFFHADPHPGNALISDAGEICMVDWGMVGRLTRTERRRLMALIQAVVGEEPEALADAILAITTRGDDGLDRTALERDLMDILDTYAAVPLERVDIGRFLMDMTHTIRTHQLHLPPNLALMIKALMTAEGMARQLYPRLNIVAEIEPLVHRVAAQRYRPSALWRDVSAGFSRLMNLQSELPKRFSQIVQKINQGELHIRFKHENLDEFEDTLENVSNRLTLAIIIAAMIIGSSMIITTGVKPLLFGYPALGVIGFLISGVLGLWLIFTILRGRRY
jgi:ubiquinone biosynthesis protein